MILPLIEQENLERTGYASYHEQHVPLYVYPSDRRANGFYSGLERYRKQVLTDYLAVTGTMTFVGRPDADPIRPKCNGVIYEGSRTCLADITDGAHCCNTHHFCSVHPGRDNWLFADGSIRFLPYRSNAVLPALATRAGGEVVNDDS